MELYAKFKKIKWEYLFDKLEKIFFKYYFLESFYYFVQIDILLILFLHYSEELGKFYQINRMIYRNFPLSIYVLLNS